jgi:hypothetical protein
LFAVEQLQPSWLGGAGRQLTYFMTTRCLGAIGLALPILLWDTPLSTRVIVLALSLVVGLYIGVVDFIFARTSRTIEKRPLSRFFAVFFGLVIGGIPMLVLSPRLSLVPHTSDTLALYLIMAGIAFSAAIDVRTLDVKPAASMGWSWRLGLDRALVALVGLVAALSVMFVLVFVVSAAAMGWKAVTVELLSRYHLLGGLVVSIGLVAAGWAWLRPRRTTHNVITAVALLLWGLQLGLVSTGATGKFALMLFLAEIVPVVVAAVFGGFTSTMIDPARGQSVGVWFWLRVPIQAFLIVALLVAIPLAIGIYFNGVRIATASPQQEISGGLQLCVAFGLVAFFRFGGFNGVQHFFLRWLLVRHGELPPRAEGFFNYAAQLALLQKVGFGYRFIHKLLLDHLAGKTAKTKL